jgi:hypothetical protein
MQTPSQAAFDWSSIEDLRSVLLCVKPHRLDHFFSPDTLSSRESLWLPWRQTVERGLPQAGPEHLVLFSFPSAAYAVEDWIIRPIADAWHGRLQASGSIHQTPRIAFIVPSRVLADDVRLRWRAAFRRRPRQERLAIPVLHTTGKVKVAHFLGPGLRSAIRTLHAERVISADILRLREEARPGGGQARRKPNHYWSHQLSTLADCGLLVPLPADVARRVRSYYEEIVGVAPGRRRIRLYLSVAAVAADCVSRSAPCSDPEESSSSGQR